MEASLTNVCALFVDDSEHGVYPKLLERPRLCWGETHRRDARLYDGPPPVVAHPPCQLWVNLAAVNWKRYKRQKPAWYPGGDDGGCFESALASVRRYGGVLEHPAYSHAWEHHQLVPPNLSGWSREYWPNEGPCRKLQFYWVCEVRQAAYGHKCEKRTWLLYCGKTPPFELDWSTTKGTHQIGWFDRRKPTVSKREASATPVKFAETLIALAEHSQKL